MQADRNEYLKKKKEKKKAKWAEIEKEGEKEKHKWEKFSSKAFGKKGFVKKSIFKTPEAVEGKVRVWIFFCLGFVFHTDLCRWAWAR